MNRYTCWTRVAMLALAAVPAYAWGPRAEVALVTTAGQIISQDGSIPLTRLEKDIRSGASVSSAMLKTLCPDAESNPLGAIESEMYLLKAVRGKRIDPYYAFRLGVLGKLVAGETAPLADANPTYRNLYYADVENQIQQAVLKPSHRVLVDSRAYFEHVQREARTHEDVIIKDYQAGLGFAGVARAALSADASRSVSAVADVWSTVLGGGVAAGVSDAQIREYYMAALAFYIQRGNAEETRRAYDQLVELGTQTTDLRKQIGDLFYDARQFDRAMQEYEAVLAVEPNRRDVVGKVTKYYMGLGDAATRDEKLEDALAAYTKAARIDSLSADAQTMRIAAEKRIAERDARLAQAQQALAQAMDLETEAGKQEMQNNIAGSLRLLQQSAARYENVPDEFLNERQAKAAGLRNVAAKMKELQEKLGTSAQILSGSGFGVDANYLVMEALPKLDEQTLRTLIESEYLTQSKRLRAELLKPE